MKITFYGSTFCPRCRQAKKNLVQLQKEFPQLEIEYREVTTSLLKTIKSGIFMIPAIRGRSGSLSGIFLPKEKIHTFLQEESRYNQ